MVRIPISIGNTCLTNRLLSASIIEDLRDYCKLHKSSVVAYYYIDFSDTANANVGGILRSLMKQICIGTDRLPKVVESLCSQHRASGQQPSTPSLISVLHALEEELGIQLFIVIDALDEYLEQERAELLHAIISLLGEGSTTMRILVTSRAEHDIEFSLSPAATEILAVENEKVDADIKIYVRQRLLEDARLCRLPIHVKEDVELKLGEGAQGMSVTSFSGPQSAVAIIASRRAYIFWAEDLLDLFSGFGGLYVK